MFRSRSDYSRRLECVKLLQAMRMNREPVLALSSSLSTSSGHGGNSKQSPPHALESLQVFVLVHVKCEITHTHSSHDTYDNITNAHTRQKLGLSSDPSGTESFKRAKLVRKTIILGELIDQYEVLREDKQYQKRRQIHREILELVAVGFSAWPP